MASKSKSKASSTATKADVEGEQKITAGAISEAPATETPVPDQTGQGEDAAKGAVAANNPAASNTSSSAPDLSSQLTAQASDSVVGSAPTEPEQRDNRIEEENLAVVVIGPKKGRWRAGRHFTHEPTMIQVVELTDDQALQIKNDPTLAVSLIDMRDA
jgi:hypothetical protein